MAAALTAHSPHSRTIEPGLTMFSAAEIRVVSAPWELICSSCAGLLPPSLPACRRRLPPLVRSTSPLARPPLPLQVLLPVGEAPEAEFQRYANLIVRHRQVRMDARRCGAAVEGCGRSRSVGPTAAAGPTVGPILLHPPAVHPGGAEQRAVVLQGGPKKPLQVFSLEGWQHALSLPAGGCCCRSRAQQLGSLAVEQQRSSVRDTLHAVACVCLPSPGSRASSGTGQQQG